MSVTRVKKRKRLDYVSLYLDVDWERTFKPKWSDSAVELSFYKGKVTINIPYGTARAKALQEQTGFVVAGTAWMHDKDIDAFIKVLRQGQRVYRMHQQDIRKVAKCEACRKIFGGVCATHRKLFKKYGKKKSPSRSLR